VRLLAIRFIGEREIMLHDVMRLATHLAEHRVHMTLEAWPNMFHVWHLFADELPEGMAALKRHMEMRGTYRGTIRDLNQKT
jgi:acetyl esterase/lipase